MKKLSAFTLAILRTLIASFIHVSLCSYIRSCFTMDGWILNISVSLLVAFLLLPLVFGFKTSKEILFYIRKKDLTTI